MIAGKIRKGEVLFGAFIHNFPPLYPVPNPLVEKITKGSVDITYNHKTQRYFYLPCKQINAGKVEY